jgi:alkylation response protein AidB-like acyl-CoA dehydrogenase
MGFDDHEAALVRASLRHVIDTSAPPETVEALLAQGWADLVEADPAVAITALAEETGAARSPAPSVELAVLWAAGLEPDASTAVVFDGFVLAGSATAERYLWLSDHQLAAHSSADVVVTPAGGFDPALGLGQATSRRQGEPVGDERAAARAVAAGRRALASQLVGAADQMLADTLGYVSERMQYRRPIGSFQSVKHRLADVKVATTGARAAVRTAWDEIGTEHETTAAIAAKCLAGRAHQAASTHCFQVHGGIAITVEHGFHQWVRRGLLLDHLLGGHEALTAELGRRLIESGTVPRMPDLAR